MSDFTESQRSIVMDRSIKLRAYLTETEVKALRNISLTVDDLHTSVIHGLIEDIMDLTGGKNLTWSGRVEKIKNIQAFIQKNTKKEYEKHTSETA